MKLIITIAEAKQYDVYPLMEPYLEKKLLMVNKDVITLFKDQYPRLWLLVIQKLF